MSIKLYENNLKKREIYKKNLLNKTYNIIKKFKVIYKKLKKDEVDILTKYKYTYYIYINNYLINHKLTYDYLVNYGTYYLDKNNKNNKNMIFFNLRKYYNIFVNNINLEINILDNILNNGINDKVLVYRGINIYNGYNKNFIKNFEKTIKKYGNKILINTYQSTTLDINISIQFKEIDGYIIEIDTNNFNYFYLTWNIGRKNVRKEFLNDSEFELLLPRNLEMEYTGKEPLYNKKLLTKYDYVYKFKIINIKLNKDDIKISKNDDIEIPINELNNLYYIQ
jgi:hypothetical protein